MPLTARGLVKLAEECGELLQVIGKKLAYWDTDDHPDGAGSLRARLEDEIGDVLAAAGTVIERFDLSAERIEHRRREKRERFARWADDESANGNHGIDAHRSDGGPNTITVSIRPAVEGCEDVPLAVDGWPTGGPHTWPPKWRAARLRRLQGERPRLCGCGQVHGPSERCGP